MEGGVLKDSPQQSCEQKNAPFVVRLSYFA